MGEDEKVEPDKGDVEVFVWIKKEERIPYKIEQVDLTQLPDLECLKEGKSPEDKREILAGKVRYLEEDLGFLSYQFEKKGIFGKEEYWTLKRGIETNFRDVDTYEKFIEKYRQLGFSKS